MMPNRIIKESICTSEDINNLTSDEEVFFYRLMVNCDDFGRMDARPQVLLAKCFPLRIGKTKTIDIEKWIQSLAKQKLITIYRVDGKEYLFLTKWEKHQQRRAQNSKYPTPISDDINRNQMISNVPEESRNRGIEESIYEDTIEEKEPPVPYSKVVELYHRLCPSYPKIRTISDERKKHIGARWRQYKGSYEDFYNLFSNAEASDFLRGNNDRRWKATFDWLLNETNMAKVLEGNYKNREPKEPEWQDPPP